MAEYIDRDKIISEIVRWEDKPYFSYHAVLRDVMNLPSADVVECKHGMWVLYNKGFGFTHYCSNCNFEVKEQWIDFYNFCPNCGADMRGGKDD